MSSPGAEVGEADTELRMNQKRKLKWVLPISSVAIFTSTSKHSGKVVLALHDFSPSWTSSSGTLDSLN